jgi:hypothetical protein
MAARTAGKYTNEQTKRQERETERKTERIKAGRYSPYSITHRPRGTMRRKGREGSACIKA